jgi:1A family penicillin-binding protein
MDRTLQHQVATRVPRISGRGMAVATYLPRLSARVTVNIHQLVDKFRDTVRAHRRLFVCGVITLALVIWAAVGASAWFVRDIVTGLPERDGLHAVSTMAQATTLLDMHDQPAFTIFKEQRIEVPLSRVSPLLVRAILAVEDQRFYEHGGVDIVRVAGAALINLRERRAAQGGSTITQQLARQSFLSSDKTIQRKLKEVVVAFRLEREFTKQQILELYLNKVYFGDGLYGVEAASRGFFGKHAKDVDLAEADLLAGLVKSPSAYAPTISRDRALARRKVALQTMLDARSISRAEYEEAVNRPLVLRDTMRREEPYGEYFKEEVRKELVQRFGWERVYQGGMRVYTTIDLQMQKAAEAEVVRALDEIEERQARKRRPGADAGPTGPLQGALVALDPSTGEVRAMVGGRDFNESRFNRATQARRQPGSAFKPFVYAVAVERGFTAASLLTKLHEPLMTLEGAWTPDDANLRSEAMTVRTALRTSSNRAAVRMLTQVGIPEAVRYAQRLGVGSVPGVPSLALGSGEVTLLSMTSAYAAFANEGMVLTPSIIRRVETSSGEVLYTRAHRPQRAVSEATAFILTTIMSDVINGGTAWQARRVGFTLPAAGKTGTTNDFHDAWFVGFTPKLVAGVWVGYDQPRTIISNGYAGNIAVPMWGRFMKAATKDDEPAWFRAPRTVTSANICRISGKLPVEGCHNAIVTASDGTISQRSLVYTEYFVRGTQPVDDCHVHSQTLFNTNVVGTTGIVEFTPPSLPPSPPAVQPVPSVAPTGGMPPEPPRAEEPKKKRGFWSRVFGIGKDEPKRRVRPPNQQ